MIHYVESFALHFLLDLRLARFGTAAFTNDSYGEDEQNECEPNYWNHEVEEQESGLAFGQQQVPFEGMSLVEV